MSISYHGIVGYGKSTLPSVESWSTNMNILRDPPKSITTRKIDKVGETSEITQMIQESGDRSCIVRIGYFYSVQFIIELKCGLLPSIIIELNQFNWFIINAYNYSFDLQLHLCITINS